MFNKEFKRMNQHAGFLGVCSGLAYAMGAKVWVIRLLTFLACFFTGSIIFWAYVAMGIFAPKWSADPADYQEVCE
jgi:phage shock protein PspC (stress-responsive transcriptional regulator)